MDSKIQIVNSQTIGQDVFDAIPVLDLMKVSWSRINPVHDSSNISRKRKITEDCESTPLKKKIAIEVIELE